MNVSAEVRRHAALGIDRLDSMTPFEDLTYLQRAAIIVCARALLKQGVTKQTTVKAAGRGEGAAMASKGRAYLQPPPDPPLFDGDVREGYHVEWRESDASWRVADRAETYLFKCRRRGCSHPVVAVLNRIHGKGTQRWFYCADHLYGRRINSGRVESPRLVPNDEEST